MNTASSHGLDRWRWLAEEPFRIFFVSGALWSMVGVLLWPAFYAKWISFYPALAHSSLMIQAFGGAFVVGFLGTAGPRVASAPPFGWKEVGALLFLHEAGALAHLLQFPLLGDEFFVGMLLLLLALLGWRVLHSHDEEGPPPQFLLAAGGLLCGIAGALIPWLAKGVPLPWVHMLGRLLLYQGFLLLPVLGIGTFLFPRMLGGGFGDDSTRRGRALLTALAVMVLILASFFLEALGYSALGNGLRLVVSAVYLLTQIHWKRPAGAPPRGSLTTGLFWALGLGALAWILIPTKPTQHASIAHLLYIGGFGFLMLVVGSRVLFGHSDQVKGFHKVSNGVRFLIFLVILTAVTRASPAWHLPMTISHHIYAAWTWAIIITIWLLWHRHRFTAT